MRSWIIVPLNVNAMRTLMYELLTAYVAGVVVFFRMDGHMRFVQGLGPEAPFAIRTFINGI